jgi:hypothetical protein
MQTKVHAERSGRAGDAAAKTVVWSQRIVDTDQREKKLAPTVVRWAETPTAPKMFVTGSGSVYAKCSCIGSLYAASTARMSPALFFPGTVRLTSRELRKMETRSRTNQQKITCSNGVKKEAK